LAELPLDKGYEVHGIKRRSSLFNTQRVDHIYQDPQMENSRFKLHYGDLSDTSNFTRILRNIEPDEVYNLGAQSHVAVSFESPEYTADVDALGTLRLLEAIRFLGLEEKTKFYQASTSELYGLVQEIPQRETTPLYPRSPYAVAKLYSYWICVNYREAYGMYACNGILFNHESTRRGETFVTKKTRGLSNIALDLERCLHMGNLDALRDWGHAKDYVRMQWMMLQQEEARDFLHVRYMANAGLFIHFLDSAIWNENTKPMLSHVNIGSGKDISIRDLAYLVSDITQFEGRVEFDASKPDGAPRTLLDVSLISSLGWKAAIELRDGIKDSLEDFKKQKTLR
jgi:GDP-mannose 4,6-dehydratase